MYSIGIHYLVLVVLVCVNGGIPDHHISYPFFLFGDDDDLIPHHHHQYVSNVYSRCIQHVHKMCSMSIQHVFGNQCVFYMYSIVIQYVYNVVSMCI